MKCSNGSIMRDKRQKNWLQSVSLIFSKEDDLNKKKDRHFYFLFVTGCHQFCSVSVKFDLRKSAFQWFLIF